MKRSIYDLCWTHDDSSDDWDEGDTRNLDRSNAQSIAATDETHEGTHRTNAQSMATDETRNLEEDSHRTNAQQSRATDDTRNLEDTHRTNAQSRATDETRRNLEDMDHRTHAQSTQARSFADVLAELSDDATDEPNPSATRPTTTTPQAAWILLVDVDSGRDMLVSHPPQMASDQLASHSSQHIPHASHISDNAEASPTIPDTLQDTLQPCPEEPPPAELECGMEPTVETPLPPTPLPPTPLPPTPLPPAPLPPTVETPPSPNILTQPGSFWFERAPPASQGSTCGTLFRLWDQLPTQPVAATPDEYDPELTIRAEPETPPATPPPPPKRWHEWPLTWPHDEDFWNLVAQEDRALQGKPWYHSDWFWQTPVLDDFEETVGVAAAYIANKLLPEADAIKIGITECINRRWDMYCADPRGGWRELHLLHAAPTAKWKIGPLDDEHIIKLKETSTGTMETRLIAIYSSDTACVNRGAGGEGASAGTPHYVYCVVR